MTSNGLVTNPARPPAAPAQIKYQNIECVCSHGLMYVFRFSFTLTTVIAKGMFMLTVTGYDL
jgi:hypothetical protein